MWIPGRPSSYQVMAALLVGFGMIPGGAAHVSSHISPPALRQSGPPSVSQPVNVSGTRTGQIGPFTAPIPLQPRTVSPGSPGSPTKEVFGFATAGSLGDPTFGYPSWNFNLLSTVAFFSISVKYNGVIGGSGWYVFNSSVMTGLINAAHTHGVKVVVTLTGPDSANDPGACDALYNGATTIGQIVAQVVAKGIDGVNVDYEDQLQMCHPTNPAFVPQTNQALLTTFAQGLRAALDAVKPGYYLSIDTYSGSAAGNDGFFNIPDLNQYVDAFFVMAYDMDEAGNATLPPLNCSSFCLNPVSPLAAYYWNDSISMSQYSAVVGAGKVILGQPYYGRVSCVGSTAAHAKPTGYVATATYLDAAAAISSPDIKPGTYIIHRDATDPAGLDRWDTWYDNSLRCWREMYWGDTTQLGERYAFVNQQNLRGVGFWTLNYGGSAPELWAALQRHFVTCTDAAVTPSVASPQPFGAIIQLTASSGNCPVPLYEFWMLAPRSTTWRVVQPFSSSATFNWDTASHVAGTYRFSVWAKDSRSVGIAGDALGRWDSVATTSYTLTTGPYVPCTGVSTALMPTGAQLSGTPFTITATPTGCSNPRYQFWMQKPGSTAWQVVQAYSTNAVFGWNSTGMLPGLYRFSTWARDASSMGAAHDSLGTWDAYSATSITLTTKPCTAVTASPAPASPQLAATPVTVTGSAAGCPSANYQFWLRAPGSTAWKVAQAYSPSAAFNWNRTAQPPGTYGVAVWSRDNSSVGTGSSSLGRWDTLTSFSYQLKSQPCTGVTATSTPAGTAAAGTAVSITATATGCPKPLYEYWMLAPGATTWRDLQPYSTGATLSWSTTGDAPGVYQFQIWARDTSSIGLAGDSLGTWDLIDPVTYTLT